MTEPGNIDGTWCRHGWHVALECPHCLRSALAAEKAAREAAELERDDWKRAEAQADGQWADERAAHEQTRAELERTQEQLLLLRESNAEMRSERVRYIDHQCDGMKAKADLATAQARVASWERQYDLEHTLHLEDERRAEAAESALASARKRILACAKYLQLKSESRQYNKLCGEALVLLSTPMPAPSEPETQL